MLLSLTSMCLTQSKEKTAMNDRSIGRRTAALFLVTIATGLACANEPAAPNVDTTTRRSAVSATASSSQGIPLSLDDVGVPPGTPLPQQIAFRLAVPGSQKSAHVKSDATAPAAAIAGPRTDSIPSQAGLIAKQQAFETRWQALAPTIANLPADQQAAQRAALKQSVAGGN